MNGDRPDRLRRRELLLAAGAALLLGPDWLGRGMLAGDAFAAAPMPTAGPRRLDLRNANTGERFHGPYRDGSGPIPDAMAELAILLRDHRVNKVGPLDIRTLDFLADVMAATGQHRATILSGYRTHATNRRLRALGFHAAEKSQHLRGHALDVAFDAGLDRAVRAARAMKRGGVGFYPKSGFVHLDSGPLRNWDIGGKGLDLELAEIKPSGPLTVQDRMKLHRELAKRQWLERQGDGG